MNFFVSNQAIILLAALCSHFVGFANLDCKNKIEDCANGRVEKAEKIDHKRNKNLIKCYGKINWYPPMVKTYLDKEIENCQNQYNKYDGYTSDLWHTAEELYRRCSKEKIK